MLTAGGCEIVPLSCMHLFWIHPGEPQLGVAEGQSGKGRLPFVANGYGVPVESLHHLEGLQRKLSAHQVQGCIHDPLPSLEPV